MSHVKTLPQNGDVGKLIPAQQGNSGKRGEGSSSPPGAGAPAAGTAPGGLLREGCEKPKWLFPASPRTISNESLSHDKGHRERVMQGSPPGTSKASWGFCPFSERIFTGDRVQRVLGQLEFSPCTVGSSSAACQTPALQRATPQHSGTLHSFITFTKFGPKSNLPFPPGKVKPPAAGPAKAPSKSREKPESQEKGLQVNKSL